MVIYHNEYGQHYGEDVNHGEYNPECVESTNIHTPLPGLPVPSRAKRNTHADIAISITDLGLADSNNRQIAKRTSDNKGALPCGYSLTVVITSNLHLEKGTIKFHDFFVKLKNYYDL